MEFMITILVTGASQGIGAAIAKRFSVMKDVVILLLARSEEKLQVVTKECRDLGADAHYYVCDLIDSAQITKVTTEILAKWKTPDVLINNAGLYQPTSFSKTTLEEFNHLININLTSAFLITQAFLPKMLEKKSGDIFFVCSTASWQPFTISPVYCAAKHGLLGLARTLREETQDKGLRVVAVMPGKTLTPSWNGTSIPEEQFIPAVDVANVIFDIHHLNRRTNIDEVIVRPRIGS